MANAASTWATIYGAIVLGQVFYFTWPKIFFKVRDLQLLRQIGSIDSEYQRQLSLWEIDPQDLERCELFDDHCNLEENKDATAQL